MKSYMKEVKKSDCYITLVTKDGLDFHRMRYIQEAVCGGKDIFVLLEKGAELPTPLNVDIVKEIHEFDGPVGSEAYNDALDGLLEVLFKTYGFMKEFEIHPCDDDMIWVSVYGENKHLTPKEKEESIAILRNIEKELG